MPRVNFPALLPILLGALAANPFAQAASGNTLQDELRIFTDENAAQCKSVKEQLEDFDVKADPLTGYNLRDAVQSLCVCLPARTEELRATLEPGDLSRALTNEELLALLNPAVIEKCAGEQLQSIYGEQCRKRFKRRRIDVNRYCPCMKAIVGGFSDKMAAAIATASSDYLPSAVEAEKNGDPVPPLPPALETYFAADQGCKVEVR